jgi:alkylation response protein AidB-like acyl-CoA dehydrogenase
MTDPAGGIVDRARALTPLIEAQAECTEEQGTMPQTVVDAVEAAGLFSILVPRELGGLEADVASTLSVFEELSYADGSTGWSVMANATTACFAAIYTDDSAAKTMFGGDRAPVFAGMLGPIGEATATDTGYAVSGRYQFASGSGHATWLGAGVMEMQDGEPALTALGLPAMRVMFVPRDEVELLGNWQVMGLAGTGSYDYRVDGAKVPGAFSFPLLEAEAKRGGAGYGLGLFGLTAVGHAAFALGVGRRALEEILCIARSKERLGGDPIVQQQLFLHDFAVHDAAVRSARSYVYESFGEAEAVALAGVAPSIEQQQRMRQSTTYATRVVADAARFAYTWAGSSGLRSPSVVQRCFRDVHAGTQHLFVDNNTLTAYTQAMLSG